MDRTTKYQLAGEAVKKCRSGEHISDEELKAGIEVLNDVIPALRAMGDCYYLASSNLRQRLSVLESFASARRRKRNA